MAEPGWRVRTCEGIHFAMQEGVVKSLEAIDLVTRAPPPFSPRPISEQKVGAIPKG